MYRFVYHVKGLLCTGLCLCKGLYSSTGLVFMSSFFLFICKVCNVQGLLCTWLVFM